MQLNHIDLKIIYFWFLIVIFLKNLNCKKNLKLYIEIKKNIKWILKIYKITLFYYTILFKFLIKIFAI